MKKITIVISTAFQDAGDATRAIEIAKAVEKHRPANIGARIVFISHGSRFEKNVQELGFEVYQANPKLPGIGLYQDLGMTIANLVGSEDLAKELLLVLSCQGSIFYITSYHKCGSLLTEQVLRRLVANLLFQYNGISFSWREWILIMC